MTDGGNRLAVANSHETQMRSVKQNELRQQLETTGLLKRFGFDNTAVDTDAVKRTVGDLLHAIGEDPSRPGLRETPRRVSSAYEELVSGYTSDPIKIINNAIFEMEYDDMVVVSDIQFYSLCEHHLLPFVGRAHVAYIPDGKIIGLSKIPRIVDMFSRRLQVQERLTQQIADFLDVILQPRGVAVMMRGQHMCSMIRGVKKHESSFSTSAMLGEFRCDRALRQELLLQIGQSRSL